MCQNEEPGTVAGWGSRTTWEMTCSAFHTLDAWGGGQVACSKWAQRRCRRVAPPQVMYYATYAEACSENSSAYCPPARMSSV